MVEADNFILICDLSPRATILWSSLSVEDCLGYTTQEVTGLSSYDLTMKEDFSQIRTAHQEGMQSDMLVSQFFLRVRHKDGRPINCSAIFSVCYECLVACVRALPTKGNPFNQSTISSTTIAHMVEPRRDALHRVRRHFEAFQNDTWDPESLCHEPRGCMIFNRFSRALGVLYASPSCRFVLQCDEEAIVGKPLLLFIRADDLASFVQQVDLAKSTNAITHMRFWFQSPNCVHEIPCEAALFGASDGMVLILRQCKSFLRRSRLLTDDTRENETGEWFTSGKPPSFESVAYKSLSPSLEMPPWSCLSRVLDVTPECSCECMACRRMRNALESDDEEDMKPLTVIDHPEIARDCLRLPDCVHLRPHHVQEGVEEVVDNGPFYQGTERGRWSVAL